MTEKQKTIVVPALIIYAIVSTCVWVYKAREVSALKSRCEVLENENARLQEEVMRLKKERARIKEPKENESKKSLPKVAKEPQGLKQGDIQRPDWEEMPLPFSDGVLVKATTNKNGRVVERYRTPDGKIHVVTRPKRRIFHNLCDNMIAAALSAANADMALPPMPLAHVSKEQFLESLKSPIEASPNDSDEVRDLKDNVAFVKEEIAKIMATEDRDLDDILAEHREQWNANVEIRREVIKATRDFLKDGDVEGAERYLEAANKKLSESGYTPIDADTINRVGVGKKR